MNVLDKKRLEMMLKMKKPKHKIELIRLIRKSKAILRRLKDGKNKDVKPIFYLLNILWNKDNRKKQFKL